MGEQITHEAEVSRQHARYRIPAKISVDEYSFSLREWSVSGFSTDHISAEIGEKKVQSGSLIFDTGDFTLSVPIEFEVHHYDRESGFMRARFVNLSRRNLALLHHVINAYLAGDIVAAGDILDVARRDNYVKKDLDSQPEQQQSAAQKTMQAVKRVVGYTVLLAVLAGLLGFIGYTIYNRLFVVDALSARVQGDVVVLRAPDNGIFEMPEGGAASNPDRGEMLGIIRLTGGGAASISNPCDCRVLSVHGLENAFVGRGEPLFTLLPVDARLAVSARVAFHDVAQLKVGQPATIRLSDGSELTGQIERIGSTGDSEVRQTAPPLMGDDRADQVASVRVVPDQTIPPDMLETVASVSFKTLGNRGSGG